MLALAQPTQTAGKTPETVPYAIYAQERNRRIAAEKKLAETEARQKQEAAREIAFRASDGLKTTPKNVALILRRKWFFPGSEENLDASGRRLMNVKRIAKELDISDKTVRKAIDLLETTGIIYDISQHGHLTSKYDRFFYRWNEDLYQHPDRMNTSSLPKKAGGKPPPLCLTCLDKGQEVPLKRKGLRYGICPCCNDHVIIKGDLPVKLAEKILDAKSRTKMVQAEDIPQMQDDAPQPKMVHDQMSDYVLHTPPPYDAPGDDRTISGPVESSRTKLVQEDEVCVSSSTDDDADQNGSTSFEIVEPPAFLGEKRIWSVGRVKPRGNGKYDKIPFIAEKKFCSQKAKSNDPSTWRTYEEAKALFKESQSWKMPFDILMLMCDGTFTLTERDDCVDKETGLFDEKALDLISRIDSYTEFSWSGGGLHIFTQGGIPHGHKSADVEMYSDARPIAWMGKHLVGTPHDVLDRQDKVMVIYEEHFGEMDRRTAEIPPLDGGGTCLFPDDEVISGAMATSEKFRLLYSGKWQQIWWFVGDRKIGYPSQSEADLALCRDLAERTNKDLKVMDRLFRQSGLYRADRWDKPARAGETYGQGTLRRALIPLGYGKGWHHDAR